MTDMANKDHPISLPWEILELLLLYSLGQFCIKPECWLSYNSSAQMTEQIISSQCSSLKNELQNGVIDWMRSVHKGNF